METRETDLDRIAFLIDRAVGDIVKSSRIRAIEAHLERIAFATMFLAYLLGGWTVGLLLMKAGFFEGW